MAAAAAEPKAQVKLTSKGMGLYQLLLEAGADKKPVDAPANADAITKQELKTKGIVKNIGGGRGKTGQLQFITPLPEVVESTRAPRSPGTSTKKAGTKKVGVISIESLERFVVDFKSALKTQASESAKSADSEVKSARAAVTNAATDDDLQNATAMLTAAINAKRDASKRAVQATVSAMLKDDSVVTLVPVLRLMKE